MSLPRQVIAGRFYLITRRCTQRQFLLRPDAETNNAFLYCLIVAACRYGIEILGTCAMSNHHHTVIHDPLGTYPEFLEHFHKLLARSQNALRGRWENFWNSQQVSVVRLVTREDVLAKLAYTFTNPVLGHLVDTVAHWPGANTYRALMTGRELEAERPRHFFRTIGPMPAKVALAQAIPEALGEREAFLLELERRVRTIESECASTRAQKAIRLIGRSTILKQSWDASPTSWAAHRRLSPRIAARNSWARLEALARNREFELAYRQARIAWRAGQPTQFPAGTYWLKRFAGVPIASRPEEGPASLVGASRGPGGQG